MSFFVVVIELESFLKIGKTPTAIIIPHIIITMKGFRIRNEESGIRNGGFEDEPSSQGVGDIG